MDRTCAPEMLDHLPPEDPGAIRSRRDLRRVNWWMGNPRLMAGALNRFLPKQASLDILEIGAGDGHFLSQVVTRLLTRPGEKQGTALDQQDLISAETVELFRAAGWKIKRVKADVFDWFQSASDRDYDAIIANLFLHHFSDDQLKRLFEVIAKRTKLFIAIEPRRAGVALLGGKLLWAIGCNSVTRHDAIVSIQAGFSNRELSELWPQDSRWICDERPAGFSSHLFVSHRKT